jgi:ABC-type transporter Mla maintaining outer membrane lipid asymmetry ATPase subunit MlaF
LPLIHIAGVVKSYPAPQPLRVTDLSVAASDRIVLSGLDEGAAEMFVHLVTGAAVPDEGAVIVSGRDTRDIRTDTEWLTSLDQFGIVTRRAVLLDTLSVAANLALPITLSIDPMSADVRKESRGRRARRGLAG